MVSGSILLAGNGFSLSSLKAAQAPAAGDSPAPAIADPSTLFGPADPVLGSANAPVTIVEFSDFECPYCRAFFTDTYSQLKKNYIDTGKVRLIFRDYPLPFHESAKPGALAAQCAHDQGKFWEYHDKIFIELEKKGQGTVPFSTADLKAWAAQIGLNTQQFNQCLDSQKHAADVQMDIQAGTKAGVSGTPSFFINGKLLVGAQPFSEFQTAINAALK
jgi:protein-disulfide isomerase